MSSLWKHRRLLWQFMLRNVELKHKGSHLGLIWSFLNPLLMLSLYVFVFGYIFGGSFGVPGHESHLDYALAIFLGLILFHFFAEVISTTPYIITSQPNFVKKIVFPLEILPSAVVGAAMIHLVISLCLLITGVLITGHPLTVQLFWLPFILVPVVALALGLGWLISALGVFFRDIGQLTQFATLTLMFSSAIFYPIQKIPPAAWLVLRFNPLLIAVHFSRDTVLWGNPPNLGQLAYFWGFSATVYVLGFLTFARLKPAFADVI